ncbi:MAG: tetratricopeptide repeat protein [Acidobacteriota bacterium]|nr:tetratricopeptide repeat protein [Acidobacteriota bacterium]
MTKTALAVASIVTLMSGAPIAQQNELGKIDFPTSGSPAAQPAFLRGVLLLHSFEYDDAKEAFLEAQQADPGFAMAYWGEAMTYNHPVWQQTAPELARAALARLAPTLEGRLAKAPTAKEKDWLTSLDSLYGPGEKLARDRAYAEHMRRMHEKYPADDEVTAFYALALLGTSHGGRDFSIYMKAAALVEQVYAKNPQHPGAAHYLIHSYDDPIHAPLGLRFADAYSKIAPAASHALHMPSHIYFALGMWDEASAINERSMKAADARRAGKQLDVDARGFHAMLWLVYGYAQQGRFEESRALLSQMEADAKTSGSVRTRSHLALARAAWLIESRKWGEAKAPVLAKGLGTDPAIADLFAIGMAAIRSGNRLAGGNALQQMAALVADTPPSAGGETGAPATGGKPTSGGATSASPVTAPPATVGQPASASTRAGISPIVESHAAHTGGQPAIGLPAAGGGPDKRAGQVMAQQLEAILLFSEGRREEALVLARQAAVVEDGMSFEFGPPVPVKPAHELVGEMLMDLRRPREAIPAFETSLKRNPRRALSLLGLGRASMAVKDMSRAMGAYGELRKIWKNADKGLPELRELGLVPPQSF